MASEFGLRVAGLVEWNQTPVPGAQIALKAAGNYYEQPAVAETLADADGRFILEYPPVGKWFIYAVSTNDEFWGWVGQSLTVGAGQVVDAGRIQFSKRMQLLEPVPHALLDTPTPVLRWASYPEAVRYHVDVFNDATGDAVLRQDTTDTSVVVDPPLAPGVQYQWSVNAYNAAKQSFAYYSCWYFTVRA
jgi:hypothetical protein